jgi:lipoprotein-anchoring transpeptidase ErfK/SrfK
MKRAIITIASLLAMSAFGGAALASTPAAPVAPVQQTVALLATVSVYASPDGARIGTVPAKRPITHERTVMPVLAETIDNSVVASGQTWLQVRLPGRATPSQSPPPTGWILASNTEPSSTPWHIVIELSARRVLVYDAGIQVRSFPAVVGKPSTPTPTGEYFVEENVKMPHNEAGAPFALATSDRSSVLHEFEGGPGEIAIHGLENVGGTLGTAESHGCIRIANAAITWMAAHIAPGAPITIH